MSQFPDIVSVRDMLEATHQLRRAYERALRARDEAEQARLEACDERDRAIRERDEAREELAASQRAYDAVLLTSTDRFKALAKASADRDAFRVLIDHQSDSIARLLEERDEARRMADAPDRDETMMLRSRVADLGDALKTTIAERDTWLAQAQAAEATLRNERDRAWARERSLRLDVRAFRVHLRATEHELESLRASQEAN